MKITVSTFWEVADIQYQRAHKLRAIWQNENETKDRVMKAFKLWLIQYARVLKLSKYALKIRQTQPTRNFAQGGISVSVSEHYTPELVIKIQDALREQLEKPSPSHSPSCDINKLCDKINKIFKR